MLAEKSNNLRKSRKKGQKKFLLLAGKIEIKSDWFCLSTGGHLIARKRWSLVALFFHDFRNRTKMS